MKLNKGPRRNLQRKAGTYRNISDAADATATVTTITTTTTTTTNNNNNNGARGSVVD
jgi:hypothetical protein